MAEVITSIGTRAAENVNITGVSGAGPWTVTLASAPSDTFAGDILNDEAASPDTYLITAVNGAELTVRDAFDGGLAAPDYSGTTQATTERCYAGATTALGLWEADLDDAPLYASGDTAKGEGYNDGGTAFDQAITSDGGGGVGLAGITLTAAAGHEGDGTAGTGFRLVASAAGLLLVDQALGTKIRWLEVDANSKLFYVLYSDTADSANNSVDHCLIHDVYTVNDHAYGMRFYYSNYPAIHNNAIYNIWCNYNYTRRACGIDFMYNTVGTIANNTICKVTKDQYGTGDSIGILYSNNAAVLLKNNLVCDVDGTSGGSHLCYSPAPTAVTAATNASSDSTAPSPIAAEPVVSAVEFISNSAPYDLHLAAGAECIDAGTDLGTTPTGVNYDIDGWDRHAGSPSRDPWDVGAHEYEPSEAPPSGSGSLSAIGSLSGSGYAPAEGDAELTATAGLVAAGYAETYGSASIQAEAILAAEGYRESAGTAEISALACLESIGYVAAAGSGSLEAAAELVGIGYTTSTGSGGLEAIAILEGTGHIEARGSAELAAAADLTAMGDADAAGSATLEAVAELVAVGDAPSLIPEGSGSLTAIAALDARGYVLSSGSADLTAIASLHATGYRLSVGSAVLEAIASIEGEGKAATIGGGLEAKISIRPALSATVSGRTLLSRRLDCRPAITAQIRVLAP